MSDTDGEMPVPRRMRRSELPEAVPRLSSVYCTRIVAPGEAVDGAVTFATARSAFGGGAVMQMFGSTFTFAVASDVPAAFVARTMYWIGPETLRSTYVVPVVVVNCVPARKIA